MLFCLLTSDWRRCFIAILSTSLRECEAPIMSTFRLASKLRQASTERAALTCQLLLPHTWIGSSTFCFALPFPPLKIGLRRPFYLNECLWIALEAAAKVWRHLRLQHWQIASPIDTFSTVLILCRWPLATDGLFVRATWTVPWPTRSVSASPFCQYHDRSLSWRLRCTLACLTSGGHYFSDWLILIAACRIRCLLIESTGDPATEKCSLLLAIVFRQLLSQPSSRRCIQRRRSDTGCAASQWHTWPGNDDRQRVTRQPTSAEASSPGNGLWLASIGLL